MLLKHIQCDLCEKFYHEWEREGCRCESKRDFSGWIFDGKAEKLAPRLKSICPSISSLFGWFRLIFSIENTRRYFIILKASNAVLLGKRFPQLCTKNNFGGEISWFCYALSIRKSHFMKFCWSLRRVFERILNFIREECVKIIRDGYGSEKNMEQMKCSWKNWGFGDESQNWKLFYWMFERNWMKGVVKFRGFQDWAKKRYREFKAVWRKY